MKTASWLMFVVNIVLGCGWSWGFGYFAGRFFRKGYIDFGDILVLGCLLAATIINLSTAKKIYNILKP